MGLLDQKFDENVKCHVCKRSPTQEELSPCCVAFSKQWCVTLYREEIDPKFKAKEERSKNRWVCPQCANKRNGKGH